jgi:ribosomal protein L16 Arg81 hydroxylase
MQANGILAAPGYQCAVHFDAQTIVTVQVLGEKRWSIQEESWLPGTPTVGWLDPAKQEVLSRELGGRVLTPPVLRPKTSQTCLGPGGAMLIPRGWWHSSWSERKSFSLTLTYVFAD